jgi:hypothetical protein
MTIDDDATAAARHLTPERAAAEAATNARLAAALREQLGRGQGDDTTRQSLGLYDAAARACRLRAAG